MKTAGILQERTMEIGMNFKKTLAAVALASAFTIPFAFTAAFAEESETAPVTVSAADESLAPGEVSGEEVEEITGVNPDETEYGEKYIEKEEVQNVLNSDVPADEVPLPGGEGLIENIEAIDYEGWSVEDHTDPKHNPEIYQDLYEVKTSDPAWVKLELWTADELYYTYLTETEDVNGQNVAVLKWNGLNTEFTHPDGSQVEPKLVNFFTIIAAGALQDNGQQDTAEGYSHIYYRHAVSEHYKKPVIEPSVSETEPVETTETVETAKTVQTAVSSNVLGYAGTLLASAGAAIVLALKRKD